MKLVDAKKLALSLILEHCSYPYPSFEFCKGQTRLGYYNPKFNIISLSSDLVENNGEEIVRDVILHEIAHSIAKGDKHGSQFKGVCKILGCSGTTKVPYEVKMPPKKYRYECPNCGAVVFRQKIMRLMACGRCCNEYTGGNYSTEYIFNITENK